MAAADCSCFAALPAAARLFLEALGQTAAPKALSDVREQDSQGSRAASAGGRPGAAARHGSGAHSRRKGGRPAPIGRGKEGFSDSPYPGRSARGESSPPPQLPAGWESAVDSARGYIYYFHQERGISQWEHPGREEADPGALPAGAAAGAEIKVWARDDRDEVDSPRSRSSGNKSWGCGSSQAPRAARERLGAARAAIPKTSDVKKRLERIPESALRVFGTQRVRVYDLGRKLRCSAAGAKQDPRLAPIGGVQLPPESLASESGQSSDCSSNVGSDRSCTSSASTGLTPPGEPGGGLGRSRGEAKEQAANELIVDGVLIRQPEDGSCLFHSIAYGLGDGAEAGALRAQIAECIGEKPTLQIAKTTIEEWVRLTAGTTTATYTQELSLQSTWGGALEMAVAAQIKGINIDVYERCHHDQFRRISSFATADTTRTVNVVYRTKPCRHYDALRIIPDCAKPS